MLGFNSLNKEKGLKMKDYIIELIFLKYNKK